MAKIIHLSDLHLGFMDLTSRFRAIVQNIVFSKEPAGDYVIVITGDLVDEAPHSDGYAEARRAVADLAGAGFQVLAVPGNHDYGCGDLGMKQYVESFKAAFYGNVYLEYPKLDVVDETAFMGLDSMAEELNWHDALFANGELGDAQLQRLDAALRDPVVQQCSHRVVYLHHHPFDPLLFMELKDAAALEEVLTSHGNVDALLFGHNHHGRAWNGKWGIPRCYDGGSSTGKDGRVGPHRVIDLARDARMDYDGNFHGVCEQPGPGPQHPAGGADRQP